MAETIVLTASRRSALGHKVGALRRAGRLPAVLYGPGVETTPLELDSREATRVLTRVRGMHLFDLSVDGATHKALVREMQRDSILGTVLHVDFYKVAMDRMIHVTVPVNLVGEAPAAKEGVLISGLTEVEIACLPGDMLSGIDADLGALLKVGDALHVRDLAVPASVRILTDGDELIARVTHQAVQEEAAPAEAAGAAEPELVERRGKEEEEEE